MTFTLKLLNDFYSQSRNPDAQSQLIDVINIRKDGFGPDYPPGHLPIDAFDFVGRHFILYKTVESREIPVATWRHTSAKQAENYRITPPFLCTVGEPSLLRHKHAIEERLALDKQKSKDTVYMGAFSISKPWRQEAGVSEIAKELGIATMIQDINHHDTRYLSGATLRFKINILLEQAGFERIQDHCGELPEFKKTSACNETIALYELITPSFWAIECLEKYESAISGILESNTPMAIAA